MRFCRLEFGMKRFFVIPCAFLIFTLGATAQTAVEREVAKVNWHLFEPPNEELTIETPVALEAVRVSDKTSRLYNGQVEGTYFFVFSFKENVTDNANDSHKLIVEFARLHQGSPTQENLDNVLVKKYSFTDKDGFHHEIVFANTKNRRYIFQTTSLQSDNALSDKFLATIRLNRKYTPEVIPAPETSAIDRGTRGGAGTGRGGGVRTGGGSGQAAGTYAATVQTDRNRTTPLRILSKPQSRYTDLARIYNVKGSIRVRVTLLSSGEIGAVTPSTKLPFGLLNSVLTAAKSIRFEPKYVNGVPVSAIVTIEYAFSLY